MGRGRLRDGGTWRVSRGTRAGPTPRTSAYCSTTCPSTCSCSAAPRCRGACSSASTPPGVVTSWPATSVTPTARSIVTDTGACRAARRPRPRRRVRPRDHRRLTRPRGRRSSEYRGPARRPITACAEPGRPVPADLHVGLDGCAEGGPDDAGPGGARRHERWAFGPTTSSTARCRSSTATRSWRWCSPSLGSGASLVFRRKFSASGFLPDVREYHCTFTSTIGRALAYILATPPSDHDRDHDLKFVLAPESSTADMRAFTRPVRAAGVRGLRLERERHRDGPEPEPAARSAGCAGRRVSTSSSSTRRPTRSARRRDSTPTASWSTRTRRSASSWAATPLDRFEGYYNNDEATSERTRNGLVLVGRPRATATRTASSTSPAATPTGSGSTARTSRPRRSSGSSQRFPGVAGRRRVRGARRPHRRRPGDGRDRAGRRRRVRSRPRSTPSSPTQRDLGTKWSPRYVRIVAALPGDGAPTRSTRRRCGGTGGSSTGDDPSTGAPSAAIPCGCSPKLIDVRSSGASLPTPASMSWARDSEHSRPPSCIDSATERADARRSAIGRALALRTPRMASTMRPRREQRSRATCARANPSRHARTGTCW